MSKDDEFYYYKIPREKHNEYARNYNANHRDEIRQKYKEFRALQIQYYKENKKNGTPIPYKFLTQKDKKLYKQKHEKSVKKGIFSIFGGKKNDSKR